MNPSHAIQTNPQQLCCNKNKSLFFSPLNISCSLSFLKYKDLQGSAKDILHKIVKENVTRKNIKSLR